MDLLAAVNRLAHTRSAVAVTNMVMVFQLVYELLD